jgi:hypothetical protein
MRYTPHPTPGQAPKGLGQLVCDTYTWKQIALKIQQVYIDVLKQKPISGIY